MRHPGQRNAAPPARKRMLNLPIIATQNSTMVRASEWLAGVATGTLATSIAIIAIALIGFAMLNGRIDWRRGATTIVGCFILFGAPAIAQALIALSRTGTDEIVVADSARATAAEAPVRPPQQDPYSGASIIR